jgi:hypothetical protein
VCTHIVNLPLSRVRTQAIWLGNASPLPCHDVDTCWILCFCQIFWAWQRGTSVNESSFVVSKGNDDMQIGRLVARTSEILEK